MGDEYFTKLYDLRNETAKVQRNNGTTANQKSLKPMPSNGGCESVSNDTRGATSKDDACEPINNE